jgi:CBS domain-containing protein
MIYTHIVTEIAPAAGTLAMACYDISWTVDQYIFTSFVFKYPNSSGVNFHSIYLLIYFWVRTGYMSGLGSIPVSRVMTAQVKTIHENDIIQKACKIMVQNNIGSVIVVAAQSVNTQTPVGIITGTDIVRHLAEEPISFSTTVIQLMSKPVVTIHPNASLQDALQTMQERDIRRLLVMSDDGNTMAGIITDKDIFRFVIRNQSPSSAFVNEEMLARNREMAERFNSSLFDDILRRRQ